MKNLLIALTMILSFNVAHAETVNINGFLDSIDKTHTEGLKCFKDINTGANQSKEMISVNCVMFEMSRTITMEYINNPRTFKELTVWLQVDPFNKKLLKLSELQAKNIVLMEQIIDPYLTEHLARGK